MDSLAGQLGLTPKALAPEYRITTAPWGTEHVNAVIAANVVALLMAFGGWWGASGEALPKRQVGWLDLSLLGVVAALAANGWFLARGRRLVRLATLLALDAQRTAAAARAGSSADGVTPSAKRARASQNGHGRKAGQGYVAVRGAIRYHRPECHLLNGRATRDVRKVEPLADGLLPCEVCRP